MILPSQFLSSVFSDAAAVIDFVGGNLAVPIRIEGVKRKVELIRTSRSHIENKGDSEAGNVFNSLRAPIFQSSPGADTGLETCQTGPKPPSNLQDRRNSAD